MGLLLMVMVMVIVMLGRMRGETAEARAEFRAERTAKPHAARQANSVWRFMPSPRLKRESLQTGESGRRCNFSLDILIL